MTKKQTEKYLGRRKNPMYKCKWERHEGFARSIRAWSKVWGHLGDYDEVLANDGMQELIRILKEVETKGYSEETYYLASVHDDTNVWEDFDKFDVGWTFGANRPPKVN